MWGVYFRAKGFIVGMVQEIERVGETQHRTQQRYDELLEEEKKHRIDIQDLLERFETQVRRVELTSERIASIADMQWMNSSGPPSAHTVDTPVHVISTERSLLDRIDRSPPSHERTILPFKTPTFPKFSGLEPDLDFVGFDKKLPVLIEALETRYGKGQTTDKLQQEFYQLSQERHEQVQSFAACLEFKYKKLINLYPGRYDLNILKERLFYGMTQHLRDSMRYLYKEVDTTYETLLSAATEAEAEWLESKSLKAKAASYVDPGKKEREELKAKIDKLTVELAKKEKGGYFKKKVQKTPSNSPTYSPKNSPRSKGPDVTAAGPFHNGKKPIQCYKCGGWGHVVRECSTSGNVNWEELNRVELPTPVVAGPELTQSKKQ